MGQPNGPAFSDITLWPLPTRAGQKAWFLPAALYRECPFNGFPAAINYVLEIYTLYLLLTVPARQWFKPTAR
jgi:hypothetical protein